MNTIDDFWRKVEKTEDCWLWTASSSNGYGQFWLNGKNKLSHRLSYEIHTGKPIPDNTAVEHTCVNITCVKPDHLRTRVYAKGMTNQIYSHLGMTVSQYVAVHRWVSRHYGKADSCNSCGRLDAARYEWSNVSRKYKRERSDWRMLCTTCHHKADYTDKQRESVSRRTRKSVKQLTIEGEVVATYKSIKVAALSVGLARTTITNNISGKSKSAGGFLWQEAL